MLTENAMDQRARRAAHRIGLNAKKTGWRSNSVDNHGGFALVDDTNCIMAGSRFDMTAEEVIDYCKE